MLALIIDGSACMWRAYHAQGLANHGVVSKTVSYVSKAIQQFNPTSTLVCWDAGKSRWRTEVFPGYKQNRDQRKKDLDLESIHAQAQTAASFLEMQGIRQVSVRGVEGDDLIAWFADYFSRILKYDKTLIFSRDKDLWQLINDNILVYDGHLDSIINRDHVERNLGIGPDLIPDLKALMGDAGDGIAGIKGIGEKTALSLITKFGSLGMIPSLDNISDLKKSKKTSKIISGVDDATFYYSLVKLSDLNSAKYYMDDTERDSLRRSLERRPVRDESGFQLLSNTCELESGFFSVSKQEEIDLTGMMAFFEPETQRGFPDFPTLDRSILECNKCTLRACCGAHGPTLAEGYTDAHIMCVARNPGATELVEGHPLCGRAGQRFDKLLEDVGLTRRDCWLTNACKCFSTDNRVPLYGDLMACAEYLRAEVDLLKPEIIMVFGNEAMSMFTPYKSGVTKHCGEILDNPTGLLGNISSKVVISVHPSAALRSGEGEAHFRYATKRIKELLNGAGHTD